MTIAAANGVANNYARQKQALFEGWDSNRDGVLAIPEYEAGISRDFTAVPMQNPNHMTLSEYATVPFIKILATAAG